MLWPAKLITIVRRVDCVIHMLVGSIRGPSAQRARDRSAECDLIIDGICQALEQRLQISLVGLH
jgi:hypothetical protein